MKGKALVEMERSTWFPGQSRSLIVDVGMKNSLQFAFVSLLGRDCIGQRAYIVGVDYNWLMPPPLLP